MNMNAAFFYGPNNIKVQNVEIDEKKLSMGEENLLLKVLSCSVCSYDVRTFRHGSFKVKPPVILGHEICAETIDAFEINGHRFKPQTRVSIYPVIPCFDCWYCKNQKYNLCSNLREIGSTVNGGFAEFVAVPKKVFEIGGVIPVSDGVTNEEVSLVEPLACCVNAVSQVRSYDFDSIIIIGDGPIALMQLMLLRKYFPANEIMVVGKIKHRLDMAKKLGANVVFKFEEYVKEDFGSSNNLEELKESHKKSSPNLIFISNNNPVSLKMAFELVSKNGKIVIFSGIKNLIDPGSSNVNSSVLMSIDPNFIHYNQVSVFGSFSSNPKDLGEAMRLVDSKELDVKNLITNTFSIYEIEEAFKTSEAFKGIKSVINRFDSCC